jgi:hypothetical protein
VTIGVTTPKGGCQVTHVRLDVNLFALAGLETGGRRDVFPCGVEEVARPKDGGQASGGKTESSGECTERSKVRRFEGWQVEEKGKRRSVRPEGLSYSNLPLTRLGGRARLSGQREAQNGNSG